MTVQASMSSASIRHKEASAIMIARFALDNRETLHPAHVNELISLACWKYTEAKTKYATRFISRRALDPTAKRQHEHVLPRLTLRTAMLTRPDRAEDILRLAVACIVTPEEHRRLHNDAFGWHRYENVDIAVTDTQLDCGANIPALAREMDAAWNRVTENDDDGNDDDSRPSRAWTP